MSPWRPGTYHVTFEGGGPVQQESDLGGLESVHITSVFRTFGAQVSTLLTRQCH